MNRTAAIKVLGLVFLACFCFFESAANGAQKATVIKMATLAPAGSSWMRTFDTLRAEVKEKTDKQVTFKIYPGGVLGDEKVMLRKMHIGQIQGAAFTSSGLSAIYREMDVFQIPFLFQNCDEVDYVVEKVDAFFKKGFEKKGYILLGWSEAGFVRLMSTIPIETLSDLKKAKVWTWEDAPMAKAIFDQAGVSAIPLSVPDVMVGLQTGLVDVVYAPPSGAILLQWFTKTKYLTDVPIIYLNGGIIIKKSVFKKITPAHQKVLLESFQTHMSQLKRVIRKQNQEALQVMAKHGVKILSPSEDQLKEFKKLSAKAMQKQQQRGKSFSKKVRDEVDAHLEAFRSEKK
jgi:TRAP-type C4-dicarboxylate transport system substrate-binding protein